MKETNQSIGFSFQDVEKHVQKKLVFFYRQPLKEVSRDISTVLMNIHVFADGCIIINTNNVI